MLEYYLKRWQLSINGEIINTPSSQIVPVIQTNGNEAILKLASCEEEKIGYLVMCWWEGEGAAKVLAHHDTALLMEKARDQRSLLTMALNNQADQATAIICNTIKQLHSPRLKQPPTKLISLQQHFLSLQKINQALPNIFAFCKNIADDLLATEQDIVVLHGDIHHRNILDFERGWLAIDPKRVIGERGFDYANLLCNPDLSIANNPAYFSRQLNNIIALSGIERTRLIKWIIAFAGLSAAWFIEDDQTPEAKFVLSIAKLAIQQLNPKMINNIDDF
ncbi:3'-kinase [Entomomonas sp. E2T0]|uniref:aminoglycoside phosphotransferase family protein n=1 Tax=Entomomonas sp. E2T0 TaxID=2930213 RepID=UPI00222828C6|nr:aminoglycoside phosphotransferase family protein [Entomomonas sp. E2T0]UYZ83856.1 3'-kinase [Entomomonas sp. E2T0]